MKDFPLSVNIKCSDSQQRQEGPCGLGTWQGVLGGSGVSLAMATPPPQKKREATPALVVQPCEALAPFVPLYSIIPSGRGWGFFVFFSCQRSKKSLLRTSKAV